MQLFIAQRKEFKEFKEKMRNFLPLNYLQDCGGNVTVVMTM